MSRAGELTHRVGHRRVRLGSMLDGPETRRERTRRVSRARCRQRRRASSAVCFPRVHRRSPADPQGPPRGRDLGLRSAYSLCSSRSQLAAGSQCSRTRPAVLPGHRPRPRLRSIRLARWRRGRHRTRPPQHGPRSRTATRPNPPAAPQRRQRYPCWCRRSVRRPTPPAHQ